MKEGEESNIYSLPTNPLIQRWKNKPKKPSKGPKQSQPSTENAGEVEQSVKWIVQRQKRDLSIPTVLDISLERRSSECPVETRDFIRGS